MRGDFAGPLGHAVVSMHNSPLAEMSLNHHSRPPGDQLVGALPRPLWKRSKWIVFN